MNIDRPHISNAASETTHFSADATPVDGGVIFRVKPITDAVYNVETGVIEAAPEVDPAVAARVELEDKIVRAVVEDAIAAGWTVGLHDGEDFAISRSTDADAVMAHTHSTDEQVLVLVGPGGDHANVWLVYGNDGWDVVSDYTTSAEPFLKRAADIGWDAWDDPAVIVRPFHTHPVCAFDESTLWIGSDEAALFLEVACADDPTLGDAWPHDLQHAVAERLTILATGGLLSSL